MPSSADRGDIVTDCTIEILAEGGFQAVTLRALADRIGVTPSASCDGSGARDLMWEAVAVALRRPLDRAHAGPSRFHRRSPLRPASCAHDVHGLLPGTDEEVIWTRVWLALVEVGRHSHRVGAVIDQIEAEERVLIERLARA